MQGPTIVLTGKAARIATLKERFQNASILSLPLLETRDKYAPDDSEIIRLLEIVNKTEYLIGAAFSTSGVQALIHINQTHQADLGKLPWCAVGKRTASMLSQELKARDLFLESPDNTGAGLAHALLSRLQTGDFKKDSSKSYTESSEKLQTNAGDYDKKSPEILAIAAERGRPEFFDILKAAGLRVHRFALYQTQARIPEPREIEAIPRDAWICFGSPSAVQAFFQTADKFINKFKYGSIGSTTSKALREKGAPVDHQASKADYADLIQEILNLY